MPYQWGKLLAMNYLINPHHRIGTQNNTGGRGALNHGSRQKKNDAPEPACPQNTIITFIV